MKFKSQTDFRTVQAGLQSGCARNRVQRKHPLIKNIHIDLLGNHN